MELEIKHLAPYLPYNLKCKWNKSNSFTLVGLQNGNESVNNELWTWKDGAKYLTGYLYECKPILRPLSEFKDEYIKEIKDFLGLGQWCEMYDDYFLAWFIDSFSIDKLVLQAPQEIFNYFLANHYDVFSLIPAGLAIDINSLNDR